MGIGGWFAERVRSNLRQYSDETELAELSSFMAGPLYFRRPVAADAETVLEVLGDPATIAEQGLTGPPDESVHEVRKRIAPDRFDLLMGVEKVSGQPVGWTELGPSRWGPEGSQSIGLLLQRRHRGNGYGRQLLFAAISLARERYRQHRFDGELHVVTAVDNIELRHIMDQLGYEPEVEIYDFQAPNGQVIEAMLFQCGLTEPWPQLGNGGF